MKRERGQSLAEFAAGAAVFSLLMLGTVALAGYQEVDRRGLLAARQAAWLGSWYADRLGVQVLSAELYASHYADAALQKPADGRRYVEPESIALAVTNGSPGGATRTAAAAMLTPLRVADGFLGAEFDLSVAGFRSGTVRARVEPMRGMPPPFDSLDLEFSSPFGLLGDAWNAGGGEHVQRRVSGLSPSGELRGLNAIWRGLRAPLSLIEPSLARLCLGIIEPDRVPEDRLGAGSTPLPGSCP